MGEVKKEDRVLLVVANLATGGDERFQKLYEWLDANAVVVAKLLVGAQYRQIETLSGDDVTSTNFVDRLTNLAAEPETKAIDVFLVLHAFPGVLIFDDRPVATSELKQQIQAANLGGKLRLLYSVACYGATHARDFVDAGFRVASGSLGANANGPYDYPTQLLHWRNCDTYRLAVNRGNNPLFKAIHDTFAQAMGFDDVNSEKVIEGKKLTRIDSEAI